MSQKQAQNIIHLWNTQQYDLLTKEIEQMGALQALLLGNQISQLPEAELFYQWFEKQILIGQVNSLFIDETAVKIDTRPKLCVNCAFHRIIPDPDLSDSFNYNDMAMVCTKIKNPKQNEKDTHVANRQQFRIITCTDRPYEVERNGTRPTWCPLPL